MNNPSDNRFEAQIDGKTAYLQYTVQDVKMIIPYTEVPSELEGQGIGSALVRAALDYARANELKVIPRCWFVAGYIERHPEYKDLI